MLILNFFVLLSGIIDEYDYFITNELRIVCNECLIYTGIYFNSMQNIYYILVILRNLETLK